LSRRIKVLALSYLFPNRERPNHGIFVLNRLKALSQYVDIKVINPIPWFPLQSMVERYSHLHKIPERDTIGGLEVYHPRFLSIPKYGKASEGDRYLKAIRPVIQKIHEEFEFDLIDMHWTFPDLPAGIAIGKKYDKKTMVTLRGMEAFHDQDNDQRREIVAKGLKDVNSIIALSQELKKHGDQLSGDPGKSTVVMNGVDTDQFFYIPKDEAREHIQMNATEVNILSVGSLIYRKGFDLLIKCIAKLKRDTKYENIRLYIIGSQGAEGDYRTELNRLIDELGVKENIVFVGQVSNDELKYWYSAADLFCLASRGEGSPNVLAEALACGCPSVTTDVGSAREIMNMAGYNTNYVTKWCEEEILTGINIVLSQITDRKACSEFFKQYSWQWCAHKVFQVLINDNSNKL
jgi:teichuronic acid biosynthesis glycosyltransferase TuaC